MLALALALLVAAQDPADAAPVVVEPAAVEPTAVVDPAVATSPVVDPAGGTADSATEGPIDPAAAADASPPVPAPNAVIAEVSPTVADVDVDRHPDALLSGGIIAASIGAGAIIGAGATLALLRVRTFGLDNVGWVTVLTVVPASVLLGGTTAVLLVPDRFGGAVLAAAGLAVGFPASLVGFVVGDIIGTPIALIALLATGGGSSAWFAVPLVAGPVIGAVVGGALGTIGGALVAKRVWDGMERARLAPDVVE